MAWLFSCFRRKQKRKCQRSSPHANHKIAVERSVLRYANVQEVQGSAESYTRSKQSLGQSSKLENDADRSLFSLLKTEITCHSPKNQLLDKPAEKERPQQVMNKVNGIKDLKAEVRDLQSVPYSPDNVRLAFDGLEVDPEVGQVEKGRHIGCLHSLLTKVNCEGEVAVLEDLALQDQNRLDYNHGVDMGELLLSRTKIESQQCDNKASEEFCNSVSRISPAAHKESSLSLEEETDLLSPVQNLLARTFQNPRGCSSEIRSTQSRWRRDESSESTPRTTEECLLVARPKRSSKALSFSDFSSLEAAADSKLTSKGLEFEKSGTIESSVATRTIGTIKVTKLRGAAEKQISKKLSASASGSLSTCNEQAISFSVSQDVDLYDTDIEVDSKAVKSHLDENSHGRLGHECAQMVGHNTRAMPLCADTIQCSKAFSYEDSNGEISEASQLFTGCNREQSVLDEVDEPDIIKQRGICSDASYLLTSPCLQRLSTGDQMFVKKKAHLRDTPSASPVLQDSSSHHGRSKLGRAPTFVSPESPAVCMRRLSQESLSFENEGSFAETSSKEINVSVNKLQAVANIADLTSKDKFLPSKLSDDVTLRPIRSFIDTSPESWIEHMTEISYDEFASPEAAPFLVPSPETVTSKMPMRSPLLLGGVTEESSAQKIMLNLPPETPSLMRSKQEFPCISSLKQQSTPRTPSVSSSEVETPSSIQNEVSPVDLEQDRPIMGTVAAHWSHSSSKEKWWDGKGIPNSTNKYKEDQKVSWHATPFEVRLERALAKQGRVFQKKLFGGNMHAEMERRTELITSSG